MDTPFGAYLRELRRAARLTLKQVEGAAQVSNAYLSQIERGIRNPPHPEILKRLSTVYKVPHRELLIAAGYLEDEGENGATPQQVEKAFTHVAGDPRFRHGTRLKGSALTLDVKRFIVEMYQKLTKQDLLGER